MASDKATYRWLIDKILDYGPSLLASSAAVLGPIWAKYKDEIRNSDLFLVFLYSLPVFFLIFLLHSLIQFILSSRKANEARASYETALAKTPSSVNPLENEFIRKIIRLSDLFIVFRPLHPHKRFSECEIVGPGVMAIMEMNTFEHCGFFDCNIICIPENHYLSGVIAFRSSSFINTNFRFVTIIVSQPIAEQMKLNFPKMEIINYLPQGTDQQGQQSP